MLQEKEEELFLAGRAKLSNIDLEGGFLEVGLFLAANNLADKFSAEFWLDDSDGGVVSANFIGPPPVGDSTIDKKGAALYSDEN